MFILDARRATGDEDVGIQEAEAHVYAFFVNVHTDMALGERIYKHYCQIILYIKNTAGPRHRRYKRGSSLYMFWFASLMNPAELSMAEQKLMSIEKRSVDKCKERGMVSLHKLGADTVRGDAQSGFALLKSPSLPPPLEGHLTNDEWVSVAT